MRRSPAGPVTTVLPFVPLLALLALGCEQAEVEVAHYEPENYIRVAHGGHAFDIPRAYIADASAPIPSENAFPALRIPIDVEPGPDVEVNDSDTFNFRVRDLPANGEPPLMEESAAAWNEEGIFAKRVVRDDRPARLVRVFSREEFPAAWHFFRHSPRKTDAERVWRAKCHVVDGPDEAIGFTNVGCVTEERFGDLYLEIRFSGTRIGCRNRIVARAVELASRWQVGQERI